MCNWAVGNFLNGADTMASQALPQPQLYSVRAAAAMLGIGRTSVWKCITNRTLETVLIGRRRMIRAESLYKLIANGTSSPTKDAA